MALASKPRRYPRPQQEQLNVRIDPATLADVNALCAMWDRAQAEVVRDAIEHRLAQLTPAERRLHEETKRSRQDAPGPRRTRRVPPQP